MSSIKVLWPDDLLPCANGTIFGWRLQQGWICVAAVLAQAQDSARRGEDDVQELGKARLLVRTEDDLASTTDIHFEKWSIHWTGDIARRDRTSLYHFISYNPPNTKRLRYLTLQPISFTSASVIDTKEETCASVLDLQDACCIANAADVNMESFQNEGRAAGNERLADDPLEEVIRRINQVHDVRKTMIGRSYPEQTHIGRALTPIGRILHLSTWVWQNFASYVLMLCNLPLWPPLGTTSPLLETSASPLRLFHLSQIFRQLSLRAQQARSLPSRWSRLYTTCPGGFGPTTARPGQNRLKTDGLRDYSIRYIDFYNTVWLVVNDAIIGWTVGAILRGNIALVSDAMTRGFEQYLVFGVQDSLMFLDHWPVGLKLNTPLSALFSHTFGSMAQTALVIANSCLAHLPTALWITSVISSFGATFFLCVCADVASLATFHLRLATIAMSVVYKWNVSGLYSLWNLFRGKRWNVMRLRVDRYDYDNDQLFLGTLLFTILLFLTPTVLSYYALFASLRFALLGMHFAIETALAFLNAFPLFALILRVKEPSRLPGGIFFAISSDGQHQDTFGSQPILQLRGKPISFAEVFAQFWASWALLMTDYSPLRLLKGIATGNI